MLDASDNVMKAMRACRHLATDQAIDGGKQPLSLFDYKVWTVMGPVCFCPGLTVAISKEGPLVRRNGWSGLASLADTGSPLTCAKK